MTANPVVATVNRGGTTESQHRGAYVVTDASGKVVRAAGDVARPVFPRSAIKSFQCVPLIESGAADHFGITDQEIALCCASHDGDAMHVKVAAAILAKAGLGEALYECGPQWPDNLHAHHALVREGQVPRSIHNNCSGKHAGMLALARHLGVPTEGYSNPDHPVQRRVVKTLEEYCDVDISKAPAGIDGCSLPTWALPLKNLALGFARLAAPQSKAGLRIIAAVRANPEMIEGTIGFDTLVMRAVPRLFLKYGAEAVNGGAIPHAGLGFALKVDDGGKRAAQVAVAGLLASLDVWTAEEKSLLQGFATITLKNRRDTAVGAVEAVL